MNRGVSIGLLAAVLAALMLAAQARHFPTYRAAVVGDTINIGQLGDLFNTSKTYSARDCEARFQDDKIVGNSTLEIQDVDINEDARKGSVLPKVPAYLLAKVTKAGDFSYTLKCGDEAGNGLIRVAEAGQFNVGDGAYVQLTFDNSTVVNRTQYVAFSGVEGDNISVSIDPKSSDSYFGNYIGKIHDLKFYVRKDDSLSEVPPSSFSKILPIREPNVYHQSGLIDNREVYGTIAVLEKDEITLSKYELQSDDKLGLVYVYVSKQTLTHDGSYVLSHCFPTLRGGKVLNYYCTYESNDTKKGGDILYYDISSTNESIEARQFSDVKSILAAKPIIRDGRTCLLAVGNDGVRRVLCLDASAGFNRTDANKDTYFSGKSVKIRHGDQDCFLKLDKIDETDFRFDDAAIFECASGEKLLASFDLGNSYDTEPEYSNVRSYMVVPVGATPLCVSDDELAYLTDSNTTLVLRGGKNRPGQLIRIPLKIDSSSLDKIHCGQDSILMLLSSKKTSNLVDVKRALRGDSFTRVNSIVPLKYKQDTIKVSTLNSAILYVQGKKGVSNVVQYNNFLGLLRVLNPKDTSVKKHKVDLIFSNGKDKQKVTYETELIADSVFTVEETGKTFKDLEPDHNYKLRDYLSIRGQVSKIDSDPKVHSVYWWPDTVDFNNSHDGSAAASRFVVDGNFVDTDKKTYAKKDGDEHKLEGEVISPSRYLGNTIISGQEVAFIGKKDGKTVFVQGWFVNKQGVVQGTEPVKLDGSYGDEYFRAPRLATISKKNVIGFNRGDGKLTGVQYNMNPDDNSFTFINTDEQIEGDWSDESMIGDYSIKPANKDAGVTSCAHFKLDGGDLSHSQTYSLCNITGGSSDRVIIRNITRDPVSRKVSFDVINYPCESFGVSQVSLWRIDSNLIGNDGTPVVPADFVYNATLRRKFGGLRTHDIKEIYDFGDEAIVLSSRDEDNRAKLYESYYGSAGDSPYFQNAYSVDNFDYRWYDLKFVQFGDKIKRVFSNYDRDYNSVSDIAFQEATLHLSKHVATDHVKTPFNLRFNNQVTLKSVLLSLDKYYPDDHKTDDDDIKPHPPPGPEPGPTPDHHPRRSRLWIILGILLLIILIGAADLYLRRRSAIAEAEAELNRDGPRVVKKKKGGKNDQGDISSSINEL